MTVEYKLKCQIVGVLRYDIENNRDMELYVN